MKPKVIVGQTWLSRDKKRKFTVISVSGTANGNPVVAVDDKRVIQTFTLDGYFYSSEFPHKFDLETLL